MYYLFACNRGLFKGYYRYVFLPIRKTVRYHEMFLIRSILQDYLVHFSTQARKIDLQKISYISGKWNFLALILKNFSYFLKRTLFLYFRKTETPKKISYIFSKESCSYISRNRNPENISYVSGNGTFLYFR